MLQAFVKLANMSNYSRFSENIEFLIFLSASKRIRKNHKPHQTTTINQKTKTKLTKLCTVSLNMYKGMERKILLNTLRNLNLSKNQVLVLLTP